MAIMHRADPTRNALGEFAESTEISGERTGRALFQECGRCRVTFLYVEPTDVRRVTLTPDEYRFPFRGVELRSILVLGTPVELES